VPRHAERLAGAAAVAYTTPMAQRRQRATGRWRGIVVGALAALALGAGVRADEGIGVFPPPGTKPVKRGIVVPDDYVLPPGFVRHYQATDDGRLLPPILMFALDAAPVDAGGKPVVVPADRVVPPELAPPGLPIHLLELPPDASSSDDKR
jgi:hypothetical protein